jgi:hypothetical protein
VLPAALKIDNDAYIILGHLQFSPVAYEILLGHLQFLPVITICSDENM